MQFWQECQENSDGKVQVYDFVNVVWKGVAILQSKIKKAQSKL